MIRKNRENRFRDRLNNLDKFFALVGGYSCDSSSSEEGIAWSPRNGPSVGHVDRGGRLRGEGGGGIVVSGNRLAGTVTINFRILCGRRNPFPRSVVPISPTGTRTRGRRGGEGRDGVRGRKRCRRTAQKCVVNVFDSDNACARAPLISCVNSISRACSIS